MIDEILFDRKTDDDFWLAEGGIEVCPEALDAEFEIPSKAKVLWLVLHHRKPKGSNFVKVTDIPSMGDSYIVVDGHVYYTLDEFYQRLRAFGFPLYVEVYYR